MIMLINTYTNFLMRIGSECNDIIEQLALSDNYREEFRKAIYDQDELDSWAQLDKIERLERKHAQLDESILPDNFWNE